jgi:hypothetical protein
MAAQHPSLKPMPLPTLHAAAFWVVFFGWQLFSPKILGKTPTNTLNNRPLAAGVPQAGYCARVQLGLLALSHVHAARSGA